MGKFLREIAFVCSEMSSYLRLQSLNSDSKQTTGHLRRQVEPQNRLQKYNIRDSLSRKIGFVPEEISGLLLSIGEHVQISYSFHFMNFTSLLSSLIANFLCTYLIL